MSSHNVLITYHLTSLGGHNDWRLQNQKELQTVPVYASPTFLRITSQFCPGFLQDGVYVWSSPLCSLTTYAGTDQYGRGTENSTWGVRFGLVGADPQSKERRYCGLCVMGYGYSKWIP